MLTERQHAIIIGTLLGDGHLERNGLHVRLKIDHSEKQSEYVQWKYNELASFGASSPVRVEYYDHRTRKIYCNYRFATHSLPGLDHYLDMFYCGGRKGIPAEIGRLFQSPLSLAVWYMDDGYMRKDCRAFHLNTQSYTDYEQTLLQECLLKNYGIETRVHKARGYQKLYIPSIMVERFVAVVEPYTIPAMSWKLTNSPVTTDPEKGEIVLTGHI